MGKTLAQLRKPPRGLVRRIGRGFNSVYGIDLKQPGERVATRV